MKIWNVLVSIVQDDEECWLDAIPFSTYDNALMYKREIVTEKRMSALEQGYIIDIDDDNIFMAYLDEYYNSDHIRIEIIEYDVK